MEYLFNVEVSTPMTYGELEDFKDWFNASIGTDYEVDKYWDIDEYWDIDVDDPVETLYRMTVYEINNSELKLIEKQERKLKHY